MLFRENVSMIISSIQAPAKKRNKYNNKNSNNINTNNNNNYYSNSHASDNMNMDVSPNASKTHTHTHSPSPSLNPSAANNDDTDINCGNAKQTASVDTELILSLDDRKRKHLLDAPCPMRSQNTQPSSCNVMIKKTRTDQCHNPSPGHDLYSPVQQVEMRGPEDDGTGHFRMVTDYDKTQNPKSNDDVNKEIEANDLKELTIDDIKESKVTNATAGTVNLFVPRSLSKASTEILTTVDKVKPRGGESGGSEREKDYEAIIENTTCSKTPTAVEQELKQDGTLLTCLDLENQRRVFPEEAPKMGPSPTAPEIQVVDTEVEASTGCYRLMELTKATSPHCNEPKDEGDLRSGEGDVTKGTSTVENDTQLGSMISEYNRSGYDSYEPQGVSEVRESLEDTTNSFICNVIYSSRRDHDNLEEVKRSPDYESNQKDDLCLGVVHQLSDGCEFGKRRRSRSSRSGSDTGMVNGRDSKMDTEEYKDHAINNNKYYLHCPIESEQELTDEQSTEKIPPCGERGKIICHSLKTPLDVEGHSVVGGNYAIDSVEQTDQHSVENLTNCTTEVPNSNWLTHSVKYKMMSQPDSTVEEKVNIEEDRHSLEGILRTEEEQQKRPAEEKREDNVESCINYQFAYNKQMVGGVTVKVENIERRVDDKDTIDYCQPHKVGKGELHETVFPNMQQHYQQQSLRTHQHTYNQEIIHDEPKFEKHQQQIHQMQLQHQTNLQHTHQMQHPHTQHPLQQQQFSQDQLFQFQHQPQQHHENSAHNQHHVHHNQVHTQMQLQQSMVLQQQHHQQLQHQRHQDENAHFMSYLHQGNHQRQQEQQVYHHQHQIQEQQRMHHETMLMSSPYVVHQQKISTGSKKLNSNPSQMATIDELMIEDYQEDHNVEYKLSLSPTNIKHENQDDGYETSAGDVLTPNSHASSSHSLTPQHQIQHSVGLLPPAKCEDPPMKQTTHGLRVSEPMHEQQAHNVTMGSEAAEGGETGSGNDNNLYVTNFIDEHLAAAGNMRMLSPRNESIAHTSDRSSYMGISSGQTQVANGAGAPMSADEVLSLQHQQEQQQQQMHVSQKFSGDNHMGGNFVVCSNSVDNQVLTKDCHNDVESLLVKPPQKKRGRKKKIVTGNSMPSVGMPNSLNEASDLTPVEDGVAMSSLVNANINVNTSVTPNHLLKTAGVSKERKKHDRFNGMSEEEVAKRILPDHLCNNLDIVIVGINPGLFAAYKGHHYAGPGNHFWKCLYLAGLTHEQMSAEEDYKLMKYGIGFTNMVQRATKGSADLTRKEIKEGSRILLEKLQRFRPKIAVFNGKLIFEVFSGKKDFNFGRQPECVQGTDTYIWVMPSSSARCAQLPRAADKVPFYTALKKFRDYLNGLVPHIDEAECVFTEQKIKQCCDQEALKLVPLGVDSGENTGAVEPGVTGLMYDVESVNGSSQQQLTNENPSHSSINNNNINQNNISNNNNLNGNNNLNSNNTNHNNNQINNNNKNLLQEDAVIIPVNQEQPQQQHQQQQPQQQPQQPHYIGQQQHQPQESYIYGSEDTVGVTGHAPGPGPPRIGDIDEASYMLPNPHCHVPPPPEKKKRGRPKKIKDITSQVGGIVDSVAGNKLHMASQMRTNNDFSNILNLSMMTSSGADIPKKKRGRPKKVKITPDHAQPPMQRIQQPPSSVPPPPIHMQQQQTDKYNSMSVNSLRGEQSMSPQLQQHAALFNTLPQRLLTTASSSPMCSPAISCSYSTVTTPAGSSQSTPPINQHQPFSSSKLDSKIDSTDLSAGHQVGHLEHRNYFSEKLLHSSAASSGASSPQHMQPVAMPSTVIATGDLTSSLSRVSSDRHMADAPRTSSPNICAVDFEPPSATSGSGQNQHNLDNDMNQRHMSLHQRLHQQNSRYPSPTTHDATVQVQQPSHESFHQWLSSNHHQPLSHPHPHQHQIHSHQQQQQPSLHHFVHHHTHPQQLLQYPDQHLHQLHQQQHQHHSSIQSYWQNHQQHQPHQVQRFDGDNATSYLIHHHQQQQHEQIVISTADHHSQQTSASQPQHLSADVSSKSLSGLESLVDQIPTISENNSASNSSLSATAAAAVESRLQSLQANSASQQRSSTSTAASETNSELYCEASSRTPNGVSNDNNDVVLGDGSGSSTPQNVNNLYSGSSPGSFSMPRLNICTSAASSPVSHASLRSPHYQQQTQQQQILMQHQHHFDTVPSARIMDLLPPSTSSAGNSSPPIAVNTRTPPLSSATAVSTQDPVSINEATSIANNIYSSATPGNSSATAVTVSTSNIHTTNFSVSHLAASSSTPPATNFNAINYPQPSTNHVPYHHSNLMAAAALAAVAASSPSARTSNSPTAASAHAHHVSPHPAQMYMDPHAHLPVPVNTMYPHPHSHAHHHSHAYGLPPQHSSAGDYDATPYGSPGAVVAAVPQSSEQSSPTHTLHMPSPNYPYGYGTPPTQSAYTSAMHAHQATPPPPPGAVSAVAAAAAAAAVAGYHHTHQHPHHHGHHASHHLAMFDRLKPSDIGGYGGF